MPDIADPCFSSGTAKVAVTPAQDKQLRLDCDAVIADKRWFILLQHKKGRHR
jgi:hypothetical protein